MSVIKFKKCTARKDHICDLCGLPIHKGSKYLYRFVNDGGVFEFKNHCHCESIMFYLCSVYFLGDMNNSEFDAACFRLLEELVYPSTGLTEEQINDKLSHYQSDKRSYLIDIINYMNEHDDMTVKYDE